MAKLKAIIAGDTTVRPLGDERLWARTHGTYIAGRAYIDGADETAAEMEARAPLGSRTVLTRLEGDGPVA